VFIAYVDRAPDLFAAGIYAWDNDFMRREGTLDIDTYSAATFSVRAVFAVHCKSWDASDVRGLEPCLGDEAYINLVKRKEGFEFMEFGNNGCCVGVQTLEGRFRGIDCIIIIV
jgi:hypothetical protein